MQLLEMKRKISATQNFNSQGSTDVDESLSQELSQIESHQDVIQREIQLLDKFNGKHLSVLEFIAFSFMNVESVPVSASLILTVRMLAHIFQCVRLLLKPFISQDVMRSCGKYSLLGMLESCHDVLDLLDGRRSFLELSPPQWRSAFSINPEDCASLSALFEAFDSLINASDELVSMHGHDKNEADNGVSNIDGMICHMFMVVVSEGLVRQILGACERFAEFENRPCTRGTACLLPTELLSSLTTATRRKSSVDKVKPKELLKFLHLLHSAE